MTVRLNHGLKSGVNNITMTKILKWRDSFGINWNSFVWYLSDEFQITDFGDNWIKVMIGTNGDVAKLYECACNYDEYEDEIAYYCDSKNSEWIKFKPNANININVLNRLSKLAIKR